MNKHVGGVLQEPERGQLVRPVFLSTDGWASKSKSSRRNGEGREAKRSRLARRRASVAATSTSRGVPGRPCGRAFARGVLELGGQGLGGGGQPQVGQVAAGLLVDRGVSHAVPSIRSA